MLGRVAKQRPPLGVDQHGAGFDRAVQPPLAMPAVQLFGETYDELQAFLGGPKAPWGQQIGQAAGTPVFGERSCHGPTILCCENALRRSAQVSIVSFRTGQQRGWPKGA